MRTGARGVKEGGLGEPQRMSEAVIRGECDG